jgi:hypothetical protein
MSWSWEVEWTELKRGSGVNNDSDHLDTVEHNNGKGRDYTFLVSSGYARRPQAFPTYPRMPKSEGHHCLNRLAALVRGRGSFVASTTAASPHYSHREGCMNTVPER